MGKVLKYGESKGRLSDIKVFLATPCFSDVNATYAFSLMTTCVRLERRGIEFNVEIYAGNCHVDDSRNRLVRDFLETDCTDLLFLDADLRFEPEDVIRILKHDVDVIGGAYRLKQEGESFAVKPINDSLEYDGDELIEVEGIATGFLRIRRRVLETLASQSQGFRAKLDHARRRKIPVIFERTIEDHTRWGGDYNFCRKWRSLGGKIYVDPRPRFEHFGEYSWSGIYKSYLKREQGKGMEDEINLIREGKENADTMIEMVESYGNPTHACMPEFLLACILLARETKGTILECGPGLSTIGMAVANPNVKIISLEHDPEWANHVNNILKKHGIKNVDIRLAKLEDYGEFEWYDYYPGDDKFDLVVCDGPPRSVKGHRSGLFRMVEPCINEGARLIFDDYEDLVGDDIKKWGGEIIVNGIDRRFAITTKKRECAIIV